MGRLMKSWEKRTALDEFIYQSRGAMFRKEFYRARLLPPSRMRSNELLISQLFRLHSLEFFCKSSHAAG